MVRVKRGNVARKRRKKILQLAKGYRGAHSRLFRVANQQVMKALRYSYVGRKQKKRLFRKIWIVRIKAFLDNYGSGINLPNWMFKLKYHQVINLFKNVNIGLNRKTLCYDQLQFYRILSKARYRAIGKFQQENIKILANLEPKNLQLTDTNISLIRKKAIKQVLVRKLLTEKTISKSSVQELFEKIKIRPIKSDFSILIQKETLQKLNKLKFTHAYLWIILNLFNPSNLYYVSKYSLRNKN